MTYCRPPIRHFGGDVSPCPPRDLRHCKYDPILIKIGRIVPEETLNKTLLGMPIYLKYVLAVPCEIV